MSSSLVMATGTYSRYLFVLQLCRGQALWLEVIVEFNYNIARLTLEGGLKF